MNEDIKELNDLINELRNTIGSGTNLEYLLPAIQLQRNRILKKALFQAHPSGDGKKIFDISNLERIADSNE